MLSGTGKHRKILISLLLMLLSADLFAQGISLSAELDRNNIWLGDTVQLTIYLQGSEEAIQPNLAIPGVIAEPLGGTVRSSRSVTNINGRITETISKAYVYGINLTPREAGRITVPAITLSVEGRTLSTEPLTLNVAEPEVSDDFYLELEFDKMTTYIDEECRLKVSFYYGTSLRSLSIMIPGLDQIAHSSLVPGDKSDSYEINVNGNPVVFKRTDKADVAGLTAVIIVRPDRRGTVLLEDSTASFEGVTGVQRVRDFFGRIQEQEIYSRQVIPGEKASLEVLPFPDAKQPVDFFGLSGDIAVGVSAEPVEVHLGDPVTIKIVISGMNNTNIEIPSLSTLLGPGFDIPDTRSSGKVEERTKTVTQTIRVNDTSVEKIPSIIFSYFDSESGMYKKASSEEIPLKVLETQVLTAADLEGGTEEGKDENKVFLEKKKEGIYYNYAGKDLLKSQNIMIDALFSSVLIKILLILPPVIFLLIWIYTGLIPQVRQRALSNVDRAKAVKQLKKFINRADTSDLRLFLQGFNSQLLEFLKNYGTDEDKSVIESEREKINWIIYGRAESSRDNAQKTARRIVVLLERKEPQND